MSVCDHEELTGGTFAVVVTHTPATPGETDPAYTVVGFEGAIEAPVIREPAGLKSVQVALAGMITAIDKMMATTNFRGNRSLYISEMHGIIKSLPTAKTSD